MGYSRRIYKVTEYKDCVNLLHTFNHFSKNFNNITFDPYLEYRLLKKLPNDCMIYYSMDVYLDILQMLNDKLDKEYLNYFDSEKYGYKSQVFLYSTPPRHEFSPRQSILSIIYRIVDDNDNRIFNIRFAPYVSNETSEFELNYGLHSNHPENKAFSMKKLPEPIRELSKEYVCSTITPCYVKIYKVSNFFFPDGLCKKRKAYTRDLDNIRNWAKQYPEYKMEFDDNGILISRNKSLKLFDIKEEMPSVSSYIYYH